MSNNSMSQVTPFTLESLVTNGQWEAAQNSRKKAAKPDTSKKNPAPSVSQAKFTKPAL